MTIIDLFPEEALRAVAAMRFDRVDGGVHVSSDGCCPMGELTRHLLVWGHVPQYRRDQWKPVMDHAGDVAWFAEDLGAGPDISADWPSEDAYAAALDAWHDDATDLIRGICEKWDSGAITSADLPRVFGVAG